MTNKEIAELMFSKMRKFGFTPYDNEGWSADYLYKVKLTFNNVDDNKIYDFYNFWFKREKYGKFDTWDCVIKLGSTFHIKGDEKPYWINYKEKEVYYDN